MDDYAVFDEASLTKIGVVCSACSTESVFDLNYEHTSNKAHACPACDAEILPAFQTEARQNYNWVTYYRRILGLQKTAKLRLYLKKQAAA